MRPTHEMERLFALEMVQRLEQHMQERHRQLSFNAGRELRSEIDFLMHTYRLIKKPEGYQLR